MEIEKRVEELEKQVQQIATTLQEKSKMRLYGAKKTYKELHRIAYIMGEVLNELMTKTEIDRLLKDAEKSAQTELDKIIQEIK